MCDRLIDKDKKEKKTRGDKERLEVIKLKKENK